MAHTCTLGEVYTSLSLITLIPCGDLKHYTTECIIPDEHYIYVDYIVLLSDILTFHLQKLSGRIIEPR